MERAALEAPRGVFRGAATQDNLSVGGPRPRRSPHLAQSPSPPHPAMTIRSTLLAASALLALGTSGHPQTSAPVPTDRVDYSFRRELLNGRGITSLAQLEGKPVLIEFWSHRCSPCTGAAVPEALRLQEEFGEDIQVILVEVGGASDHQVASFALGKKWLGGPAMWTTERPVDLPASEVPSFVLLSPRGEISLQGKTQDHLREIDDELGQLIRSSGKPPKDLSKELGRAWVACNEGDFVKAKEIADKSLEDASDDGVKRAEAQRILKMIAERIESQLKRVRWLMDHGYPIEATEMIESLKKGLKGMAEHEAAIKKLEERLETPEMKLELEAQKALAKIEKKIYEEPRRALREAAPEDRGALPAHQDGRAREPAREDRGDLIQPDSVRRAGRRERATARFLLGRP